MKFLYFLLGLVAFAAAEVNYTAPQRGCAWNVVVDCVDEFGGVNGKGAYSQWLSFTHYFNGLFYASRAKNYGGDVLALSIYRPDLNARYSSGDGMCSGYEIPEGVKIDTFEKLLNMVDHFSMGDDEETHPILHMITGYHPFLRVEDGEWDGKKAKKYYNFDTSIYSAIFYVNAKNDEPLAYQVISKVDVLGVSISHTYTYTFDFGTKALMSDFSFSRSEVWKCPDERIYKSGDDAYAFCAAFTTKAALSLVLAAIAVALLSVF